MMWGRLEIDCNGFVEPSDGNFQPLRINTSAKTEWKINATRAVTQAIIVQLQATLNDPNEEVREDEHSPKKRRENKLLRFHQCN